MSALVILTAWTLASIPLALLVSRFMSPSPCERDAQDGRGEGAEIHFHREASK